MTEDVRQKFTGAIFDITVGYRRFGNGYVLLSYKRISVSISCLLFRVLFPLLFHTRTFC